MGVTKPSYTEEQLQALDPPPFTYEGRQYTAYEAQQQMRKMERSMRRQKDKCIVFDAAGDVENYTVSSIHLRRMKDVYEDFARQANAFTEYERLFVVDYNRHLAGKTAYATKTWRQMQSLVGSTTSNGLQVTYVSDHFVGQSIYRKVSLKDIDNALTKPLDYGKIKVDSKGRRSQKYIGASAVVSINPDTGELITAWQTSTKLKRKYGVI